MSTALTLANLDGPQIVSLFRMRVATKSPFFTVLSYNCKFIGFTNSKEIAYTNGRAVYFNVAYFAALSNPQRTAIFIHELLHIAYSHIPRCRHRDPFTWNIASDIYVNQIITELEYCTLPDNAVLEPDLWRETTEEIYELLLQNPDSIDKYQGNRDQIIDLRPTAGDGEGDGDEDKDGDSPGTNGKPLTPEEAAGLIANWDRLLEVAQQEQLNKTDKYGSMPSKLARTLTNLNQPQIDWRQALLNYLTTSPNDYAGFDRRFIAAGCYDDCLDGQTVRVDVCIDTSGSIGEKELGVFISELAGILQSYPEVNCDLYWADTVAYGPYSIEDLASVPKPEGGGGTCFKDFFIKSAAMTDKESAGIAIYLTDGYGSFPEEEPPIDTLWVVSHDGLNLNKFPFGLAVKLTS